MTYQIDTTGVVNNATHDADGLLLSWRWTDLSPFTQGYVEAAFASVDYCFPSEGFVGPTYGFRHLAPETLARIIADCEQIHRQSLTESGSSYLGRSVWESRARGEFSHFPPLTVRLSDGKVRFA